MKILSVFFLSLALTAGPTKKIIYNFTGLIDGGNPAAGLVRDPAGVLYGTTSNGGSLGCLEGGSCGVVFTLTPPQTGGAWIENPIYAFQNSDPSSPTTGVVLDKNGNLYGDIETSVYQLVPPHAGMGWTYNLLYNTQGNFFTGDPVVNAAGDLFFPSRNGVIELIPGGSGMWTTDVISTETVGSSSLVLDRAGHLYGVSPNAGLPNCGALGTSGCGIIFELSLQSSGSWTYRTIYEFTSESTGYSPQYGLAIDGAGNLYGSAGITNSNCAAQSGCAVVFQLSRPAVESQPWTETPLHTFEGGTDGALLDGSLSVDRHGAVYGTTYTGGTGFCSGMGCGTVFQLKPPAQPVGPWIETLYSFQGGSDGAMPQGSVLVNEKTGMLYGTTTFGGAYNAGIVYELVFP